MNDNFLYELRTPPSPEFASRLKARLDVQAGEARRKRRAFKWFVFGAILMGGTALAFVSPSVRQAAWTMIVQFRGTSMSGTNPDTTALRNDGSVTRPNDASSTDAENATELESREETPSSAGQSADAFASDQTGASATADLPPANNSASIVAGAQGPRATVSLGYVGPLQALAENLAVDLEERLKTTQIEPVERPAAADLCARDSQSLRMDLLLSDLRRAGHERTVCAGRGRILEIAIAYDPLVLIIHRENTWARSISLTDLKKFEERHPAASVTTWSQVRPAWPTLPVSLVGTSLQKTAGGRRFAEIAGLSRDPTVLEVTKDDRVTMRTVEGALGAIGYIPWRSLEQVTSERSGWPTTVAIIDANGQAVEPTASEIKAGRYPLAQPIWLYVDTNRLSRIEVWNFLQELLNVTPPKAIERSGFVSVGEIERKATMHALLQARPGAMRY